VRRKALVCAALPDAPADGSKQQAEHDRNQAQRNPAVDLRLFVSDGRQSDQKDANQAPQHSFVHDAPNPAPFWYVRRKGTAAAKNAQTSQVIEL
jgi:hypothetical protein